MARIEQKAHYIGTWREDIVMDATLRQIIARCIMEKGQKVKVKLSKEGLSLSKTVFFQENFLSSFSLDEVYHVTASQQHPTCVLCIVADPVKNFLILALRTPTHVDTHHLIKFFQALKAQPSPGNQNGVVLRRKQNGNWTLKDRIHHTAERQLQEVFTDMSATPNATTSTHLPPQPNGHVKNYGAPVPESRKWVSAGVAGENSQTTHRVQHSGAQTVGEGNEDDLETMRHEVENLTQELRTLKLVLQKANSGTLTVDTNANNTTTFRKNSQRNNHVIHENGGVDMAHRDLISVYPESDGEQGHSVLQNGGDVSFHTVEGSGRDGRKEGEVRVQVKDYRQQTMQRADSSSSGMSPGKFRQANGVVKRQITVPSSSSSPLSASNPSLAAYSDMLGYPPNRNPSQPVFVFPEYRRSQSARSSLRTRPTPATLSKAQQYRSIRVSRSSGTPSTVVKPIEEIYGQRMTMLQHRPVVFGGRQPVYYMQQQASGVPVSTDLWPGPASHHNDWDREDDYLDDVLL